MTSSLPNSSTAFATHALTCASFETSHLTATARGASGYLSATRLTARWAACSLMSAATTWAPSEAKRRVDSRPMPLRGERGSDKWGGGGADWEGGKGLRACASDDGDLVLEAERSGHGPCSEGRVRGGRSGGRREEPPGRPPLHHPLPGSGDRALLSSQPKTAHQDDPSNQPPHRPCRCTSILRPTTPVRSQSPRDRQLPARSCLTRTAPELTNSRLNARACPWRPCPPLPRRAALPPLLGSPSSDPWAPIHTRRVLPSG